MPGPWGLTPGELAAARAHSINTATSIEDQLAALNRYVDELAGEWTGVAKDTFRSLMDQYHTHAQNLQETLEGIAQNLQSNHDAVVDTENLNVSLLTPHNESGVDLRPARF